MVRVTTKVVSYARRKSVQVKIGIKTSVFFLVLKIGISRAPQKYCRSHRTKLLDIKIKNSSY